MQEASTKRCPLCQESKSILLFNKNKSKKDGLQGYCKECTKIKYFQYKEKDPEAFYLRSKTWRENNKEHKALMDKKWAENNREKSQEIKRRWKKNHKEQNDLINKIYWQNHKERKNLLYKKWRENNPEKHRLKEHRRRARKANNGIFLVSDKEIKKMLQKPCYYCGKESQHIDHIIPISRRWQT